MTRLFDGMAGILAGVFGDRIRYQPAAGPEREVVSIFRAMPIEVTAADGQILRIDAPTWRVRANLVPELARGDRIELPTVGRFTVQVMHKSGSPAADAVVICELHGEDGE
ncbi:head-tail joining protein [Paracoccus hibiscisoli]|uniref:Head-tail adaptor protein n=1 Tax=Paracoccus hibiscisoli TaxID=2023261 RepID=A0A4U0QVJ6_9RHOB|nr:hypothetical protein [Paracoccus hibiscisoli]TJZ86155.1 hypothetical protein FA740_04510 [Paracoccus hibiscisoli]